MRNTFIGIPMERREDLRFLRGRGEYVDDLPIPGLLHAVMLRSSVGHGRLVSVDTSRALACRGVHAVVTAADMPGGPPTIPTRIFSQPEFKAYQQPVLAHDKVRYVGEPIAMVLADSIALGEDALDSIDVTIEDLPAVADWTVAQTDKSLLFENNGSNRPLTFQACKGDADAVFASAPYVRRERFRTGRHYSHIMEPRGIVASWDEAKGKLTVYGAAKIPFVSRRLLSGLIDLPVEQIDLIENDVGGGYGARGEIYPEDVLVALAARRFNRPIKWIEDRRENLMATNHAREQEAMLEVACERDGTILAIRGEVHTDMGAYVRTNGAVAPSNVCQFMAGPYRVAHIKIDSHMWVTNKTPVGTYRGPGRFEPCFFMERMVDIIAEDLGIDCIEFRRKNLIRADEQPYQIATVHPTNASDEYDNGDYHATLDRALSEIDWQKLSPLQGRMIDGKCHGVGIACFIESGSSGPKETARFEVAEDGRIALYIGSSALGQGVETVFAQIAADALEVPIERISQVFHGSTTAVSDGYGAAHCRSTAMGGSAVLEAAKNFLGVLRERAAPRLQCEAAAIALDVDKLVGGGSSVPLSDFAGVTVEGVFLNKKHTYSYGTHAAHVTVDPKTGQIEILDYVVVEDVGRIVNPLTLGGQIIGSLVQGLGGAVLEHLKYDENGQLLTGSLADYLLPMATDFPNLRCVLLDDYPSPLNPLGAKGAGEGGTIGSGGCIANAVANALQGFGAQVRELPLSHVAIWEMVQAGRQRAAE